MILQIRSNSLRPKDTEQALLKSWSHLKTTYEADSEYTYLVIGSRYVANDFIPSNTQVASRHTVSTALYYIDNIQVFLDTPPKKDFVVQKLETKKSTKIFNKKIVLEAVVFKYDSYELDEKGRELLKEIYNKLSNSKIIKLSIDGFTDAQGTEEYNMKLSHKRALAVYNYLLHLGIEKSIMTYEGHGEEQLLDTINPNSHKNRRVEITMKYKNE